MVLMPEREERVAYRTTAQSGALLVGLPIYVLVWVVGIIQIAIDNNNATRAAIGIAVIAAHLVFVVWLIGYRCAFAGVFPGPDDVIVRNPWRSHRLTWDSIESFTVEPYGPWSKGHVRTRDGRSIPIYGIQGQMRALHEQPLGGRPDRRAQPAPSGETRTGSEVGIISDGTLSDRTGCDLLKGYRRGSGIAMNIRLARRKVTVGPFSSGEGCE